MQKRYRVKKSKEIEHIMRKGRSKSTPYFIVYKIQKVENKNFRVAISVGKKIGNAVTRNKVKRYIRNVMNNNKENINETYDYFIIARKGVADLDHDTFTKNLESLLRKSDVIKKELKNK
ncbi:MAG: ribonuclease P protein component [Turicibacter sp.]